MDFLKTYNKLFEMALQRPNTGGQNSYSNVSFPFSWPGGNLSILFTCNRQNAYSMGFNYGLCGTMSLVRL
jgi:hypothetical protein